MSKLSNYQENAYVNHLLRGSALSAPTIYAALFLTDPAEDASGTEASGNGYSRVEVPAASWNAASSKEITNSAEIFFPIAFGNGWGTVAYLAFFDATNGGNMFHYIPLTSTLAIENGSRATFSAGSITLQLTGNMSPYAANALLNLTYRGVAFTPPATYASLHLTDPGDTGSGEVSGNNYGRVLVSAWDSPSNGATANTNSIAFPSPTPSDYGTIAYKGLFDASTGGNFLVAAQLDNTLATSVGESPTDSPGGFDVVFQ